MKIAIFTTLFCNVLLFRRVDRDPKMLRTKFLALRVVRKFIALRITCVAFHVYNYVVRNCNLYNIIYSEAKRIFLYLSVAIPVTSYGEQSGGIKHTKSAAPFHPQERWCFNIGKKSQLLALDIIQSRYEKIRGHVLPTVSPRGTASLLFPIITVQSRYRNDSIHPRILCDGEVSKRSIENRSECRDGDVDVDSERRQRDGWLVSKSV